jgi:hypothetical protein
MVLDDPSLTTFDDLSSTTCDDDDNDDVRMSIGTAWDKSAASGEDKIAAGGRKENENIKDVDDDDYAADDEKFWLAASGKVEDSGHIV